MFHATHRKLLNPQQFHLHAFLDGRDTPPRSAEASLQRVEDHFKAIGVGQVAPVIGRYYAMDRDKRWDRVQAAYDLLTQGKADYQAKSAVDALKAAYNRDENDEFVKATAITTAAGDVVKMQDGDSLIFMNFRADRARQFSRAFIDADFAGFQRDYQPKLASFVMLTEYAADIKAPCAHPPGDVS